MSIVGINTYVPIVITGTQGNPAFKINGGSEVTTGSISHGQTLTLVMDSSDSFNQSHKMQVKVGDGTTVPWRVWTGDSTSNIEKRVFMAFTNGLFVGVLGGDLTCQNAATAQSLSGTWKAIISGDIEEEYAINRIGYNWNILKMVEGTIITNQPAEIWNTANIPFQNGINRTADGTLQHGKEIYTGTTSLGFKYNLTGTSGNCLNWTEWLYPIPSVGVSGSTNNLWISNGTASSACGNSKYIYCIEQ